MDDAGNIWYYPAMMTIAQNIPGAQSIPVWQLYGEDSPFPDLLHVERIVDRAAGLDWQIAAHRHLHLHQVFLILSGQLWLTVDGHSLTGQPSVLMNIPRGAVHGFRFSAGTDGYVLTLPAPDFPEIFNPGAETAGRLAQPFVLPAPAGMEATFALIAAEHGRNGPLRRLKLRAGAISLCCAVAEVADPGAAVAASGDPRMVRFGALVRDRLAQGWQLADYAAALALSERHLRRLCQQETGLSAHAFIESIRLHEACRLLAYTRMRVHDVGFALGFEDPAYFARVFRRGTGMAPGQYRAKLERAA